MLSYWRTLGNLKTYIDSSRVCNFKKDIKLLYDVACAFNYCHSQDIPIYHMNLSDIKVLFILEDSIEVTGFGVKSFPLNSRSPVGCDYLLKRPEWVPPEYIENTQHFNVPEYDVFSYGILMCKLLSRTDPYEDMNPMRLAINIVKNSLTPFIPKGIPDSITNLILSCVNKNPKARPSFENICEVIKRTIGIPSGGNGAERGAASPVVSWSEKFESDKSYQYSE